MKHHVFLFKGIRLLTGVAATVLYLGSFACLDAQALDLDWSGQFRSENHWVFNYSITGNETKDPAKVQSNGYYAPGGGERNAYFQTLFMRLRPIVVVNDNVAIKSEWWAGDPVYGIFGNAAGLSNDQRQYYSTQSRGSLITAQRFWGEFQSDFGTVQVGRAPIHWGLGLFWNSGDGLWDRYASTADLIRLVSKFGSFTFTPQVAKYSVGNGIGGACINAPDPTTGSYPATCTTTDPGGGGLTDYSIAFTYDNKDEDLEMGLLYVKRIAGGSQDRRTGTLGVEGQPAGSKFNHWDVYGRKKVGKFTFTGDLPIVNGDVSGIDFRTWAAALEAKWQISDTWQSELKFGRAPGQPDYRAGTRPGIFKAYYFNPNYKIALIMFNYGLHGFAGPNTTNNPNTSPTSMASPFDNPIVNAKYAAWAGSFTTAKWTFRGNFVLAQAIETAGTSDIFFNHWTRSFAGKNPNAGVQSSFLGWETDLGATFRWDESVELGWEWGLWFPGGYYAFQNSPVGVNIDPVIASVFRVGVVF